MPVDAVRRRCEHEFRYACKTASSFCALWGKLCLAAAITVSSNGDGDPGNED